MAQDWWPEGRGAKGLPFRLCEYKKCAGRPAVYVNGKYLCEVHGRDAIELKQQMDLKEMIAKEAGWLKEQGMLVIGGQVIKRKES